MPTLIYRKEPRPSGSGRGFLLPLFFLMATGCGTTVPPSPTDKAEAVVERFLDAWTRGDSPEKFAEANPSIQVTDPDWKAGYRLLSFLGKDAKQSQQTPPRFLCRVSLSVQDRKGKKLDKEVAYDVRMEEKIVIGRAER